MYWPWKTLIKAKFIKEKKFYSIQYKFQHGIAFNDPKQNQNGQFNKLNTTMMPYHIDTFKEIWNQNKSQIVVWIKYIFPFLDIHVTWFN